MDDEAGFGEQRIPDRVRHAVGNLERFEVDMVAHHTHAARRDFLEVGGHAVLGQFFLHHAEREAGAADGRLGKLAQQVGQRSDVVFVRVGEQDRVELAGLFQIAQVGGDDLDPERLLGVGKHQAAVDDDAVAAGLDDHAVHPDLAQAAERDDANRRRRIRHSPVVLRERVLFKVTASSAPRRRGGRGVFLFFKPNLRALRGSAVRSETCSARHCAWIRWRKCSIRRSSRPCGTARGRS